MSLSCIAIDDEPLALQLIANFTDRHPDLNLLGTFENALLAETFLQQHSVDLLFLDVDMPDLNGITLAKRLSIKPLLILTTAYRNYAYEGYELNAVDFLLKPFDFTRFSKAVDKALQQYKPALKNEDFIAVYAEYQLVRINVQDIEFITAMEDYVRIHLLNGKTIMTLSTMSGILQRLPMGEFMRVHRSFIVALRYVQSFSNKKLQLQTTEVRVGNRYLADVFEKLKR